MESVEIRKRGKTRKFQKPFGDAAADWVPCDIFAWALPSDVTANNSKKLFPAKPLVKVFKSSQAYIDVKAYEQRRRTRGGIVIDITRG